MIDLSPKAVHGVVVVKDTRSTKLTPSSFNDQSGSVMSNSLSSWVTVTPLLPILVSVGVRLDSNSRHTHALAEDRHPKRCRRDGGRPPTERS